MKGKFVRNLEVVVMAHFKISFWHLQANLNETTKNMTIGGMYHLHTCQNSTVISVCLVLRINGATGLLPLYAFMPQMG